jgi:hypothetical protein
MMTARAAEQLYRLEVAIVSRMIFVNLPVADLNPCVAIHQAPGLENDPVFTDESAASCDSRDAVDALSDTAASLNDGTADINPTQDRRSRSTRSSLCPLSSPPNGR